MYPYFRMVKEVFKFRNASALSILDPHISHHMCLPGDLDPWLELNNGRTLTLYDLGRIPMAKRMGLNKILRAQGWGLTVAGASTRYRRRVTAFQRFEMVSRCIGWDARFLYMEQSMWRGSECTSHMLLRSAIASKAGIVAPEKLLAALGQPQESPRLPDWSAAWIAADAQRPWPPVR